MTTTSDTGTEHVNGAAPADAGQDAGPAAAVLDAIPVSERIMGAIGLLFAIGIGLVAVDLLTGGWVSDTFAGWTGGSGDQPGE